MKIFFTLMFTCFAVLTSFAQYNNVTLKVNGNKNRKVVLDGKSYVMTNVNPKANNKNITIANVQPGQHTIQVIRTNKSTNTYATRFMVRSGYDVIITINGTGAAQVKEKQRPSTVETPGEEQAMNATAFASLQQDLHNQWQAGAKFTMMNNVFANIANHFTTKQVGSLIQLVDAEDSRLSLLKNSYRSITDRNNFSSIYSLLADQTSRNELSVFIDNYNNNTSTTDNTGAMNTAAFSVLLKDVQDQWQAGAKQAMIANAFSNLNNSFNTAQVTQLLQLIDAEDTRLMLAKASYRSITDRMNFTKISGLLNTQASKNELSAYVNNYNNNSPVAHVAMNNTAFTTLLQNLLNEWPASSRLALIINTLNGNDYFSTSQARQIIQTVDAESSRLQLAKTAYKHITDIANYNTISDLLYTQASRNDLINFINNGGQLTNAIPVKTSMSDAAFETVLNNIKSQWLPGSKMLAVQQVFAQADNYFSTAQVRQLVVFVTTEANRLQLLKASFKNVTDKTNFSSLYDLLLTQSSKDELTNYINA